MYRESRTLKIVDLQGKIEHKRKRTFKLMQKGINKVIINSRVKELNEMNIILDKLKYKNMSRKEKKYAN